MSTYFSMTGDWPTLSHAISTNQRVFVFIDPTLSENNRSNDMPPWNHLSLFSTYEMPGQDDNDCRTPLLNLAQNRCNTTADIIIEAGFIPGVCLVNGQDNCNRILPEATEICYSQRNGQTVNVVAVDHPERENSTVFYVVNELNGRNIEMYSPLSTITEPLTTVSVSAASTQYVVFYFGLVVNILVCGSAL